jgi:hypothetical protein
MKKPMSAENLILCLCGELFTDPNGLVDLIKEDEETRAIVRLYGQGKATYDQVLKKVTAIC